MLQTLKISSKSAHLCTYQAHTGRQTKPFALPGPLFGQRRYEKQENNNTNNVSCNNAISEMYVNQLKLHCTKKQYTTRQKYKEIGTQVRYRMQPTEIL